MPTDCEKYAAADRFITMKGLAGKGQFLGVDEINAWPKRMLQAKPGSIII